MRQRRGAIRQSRPQNRPLSQPNYEQSQHADRSGTDLYGQRREPIYDPLSIEQLDLYDRTFPIWPSPPMPRPGHISLPSAQRPGASLTHQPQTYQPKLRPQNPPLTTIQTGIEQCSVQLSDARLPPRSTSRMDYVVNRPFTGRVVEVRQRNELRYQHPSASTSNSDFVPGEGSTQRAIKTSLQRKGQVQSSLMKTIRRFPQKYRSPRSPLMPATANWAFPDDQNFQDGVIISKPRPYIELPKPDALDRTTYRVDASGTRIPKTQPPPQGTYKASEGIGRTDYSDPRDFFTPLLEEQQHVWHALQSTRAAFWELTLNRLKPDDLKTLSMGYNAARSEIKRVFVRWVFENFSPDRAGPDRRTVSVYEHSGEVAGYGAVEEQVLVKQPYNPKNIKYFTNGELSVNIDELLPELERWYGLIGDYRFSPNWPYERYRNSKGMLVQNPECFACKHCRVNQILCHGFRERASQQCSPCASSGLKCSIAEDTTSN